MYCEVCIGEVFYLCCEYFGDMICLFLVIIGCCWVGVVDVFGE